ncbi:MAG: STAS domain-containing protein [Chloroflexota bacterium]|nr:STAS domain-containing protein [Chloroflexota bacterium]
MKVTVENQPNGAAVVRLSGRLDLVSAGEVKQNISQAVGKGQKRLVVDLGDVQFIDSSGLGALIGGLKTTRQAGGDLRIARPGQQAVIILQLTTLDKVLWPYTSVEEALAGY